MLKYLLFRMATLLPWNFFITPFAYWMTKLQRVDWKNRTMSPGLTEEEISLEVTAVVNESSKSLRMGAGVVAPIVELPCPQAFEFNEYQRFWNSSLGIATMVTNLLFCFLTTILAVSSSFKIALFMCVVKKLCSI